MRFNFENEKYNRHLDKNLFFNLTNKEKEIYAKLKRRSPVENIIVSIGDTFSSADYKNLKKEELKDILANAKSNSVVWERKMIVAEDVLVAIKKANSNPKMLFKLFFGKSGNKSIKPYWEFTRTLFSILGTKMIEIDKSEKEWLNSLEFKNKYASEEEIIDPLFNILDTNEGHKFIQHLYECKNTICTCMETREGLNDLINKAREYRSEMETEYFIYDSLMKENPNAVMGLINKCMDVYWITRLFYVIKNGNVNMTRRRNVKLEYKKQKENECNKDHNERNE